MNAFVLNEANEIETRSSGLVQPPVDPRAVLAELFELLENYGPAWYNEAHHDRAIAALLTP
jgi:hypothetical protein